VNAADIAIIITALGSLAGAVVAGIALLKKTTGENVDTLSAKLEKTNTRLDEADEKRESDRVEFERRMTERDKHIARQDRALIAFRKYTFALRRILADRGIDAPPEPAELEMTEVGE
jgi:hypothetical protein